MLVLLARRVKSLVLLFKVAVDAGLQNVMIVCLAMVLKKILQPASHARL